MKRIVGKDWSLVLAATALTIVLVGLTGTEAGGVYLFGTASLALFAGIRYREELEELWGEKLKRFWRRIRLVRR